jgi:hypothetical protein
MTARISALVIILVIIALVLAFMAQRIGAVIGWDDARGAWPLIAVFALIVLIIGWFMFIAIRNKLNL